MKFIISGGGTGGHIYPAIAIANELKARYNNAEFLFVGAKNRMEMEKVPEAGYEIEGLWISGLQRSLSLKNLMFPFKLLFSMLKSRKIIRKFKPTAAIGTGGYASAPLLKTAASKGIPCLIQEQNSYPGITNKWLSKNVDKICVAYDGLEQFFPKQKIKLTGNPVRQDLISITVSKEEALEYFKLNPERKTLLILGGSLGARAINVLVSNSLKFFEENDIQLIWQCGKFYEEEYKSRETDLVKVHSFLDRMDMAYTAADFIISRAGALSVSELCLVGKPVIFIPSPNVAEDHQTHNAQSIVDKNAAVLIKESEANSIFEKEFSELLNSSDRQKQLSENIKKLAHPNATKDIVNEIELLIQSNRSYGS